jgi:hypothetical protein
MKNKDFFYIKGKGNIGERKGWDTKRRRGLITPLVYFLYPHL